MLHIVVHVFVRVIPCVFGKKSSGVCEGVCLSLSKTLKDHRAETWACLTLLSQRLSQAVKTLLQSQLGRIPQLGDLPLAE